jgi:hypothetical protein
VPAGLQKVGGLWSAAIPGYAPAFVRDPLVGYLIAAVIGSALVIGVTLGLGKLLSRRRDAAGPDAGDGA